MNKIRWALLLSFAGILATGAIARADDVNTIRAIVGPMENSDGTVRCALYGSADGFPAEPKKAVARTEGKVSGGKAVCEFKNVKPGQYAVSTLHDEDSDGEMDSNFLGIPSEAYGASNDAKGSMGPPSFSDARFEFKGGLLELKIKLNY